jgi:predicted ATPase
MRSRWTSAENSRHQMDSDTSSARQLEETIRRQARAKSRRRRFIEADEFDSMESRFDEIRREMDER